MARLLVGPAAITGDMRTAHERFDIVEVRAGDGAWPKDSTLKRWRKSAPPAFVFTVVLPPRVASLAQGADVDDLLTETLHVAAILQARCVLLQTPPDVRPTAANRKRIAALFEKIPAEGTVRCWEPSGLWEPEDIFATARSARVLPVLDATQEVLPPGAIVYTRVRAMSKAATSARGLEKLASSIRGRREAFVVAEDPKVASALRAALPKLVKERAARQGPVLVRQSTAPLIAEDEEQ
ncbi:MAG: DUF72 domain-containing protein [Polyangiaceae bacterium]|nr:DUF72 domain-containing protein [Polyangiaceae bacterium]